MLAVIASVVADVNELPGITTHLHEDGYHYEKPSIPFPPPPSKPDCPNGGSPPDCCSNGGEKPKDSLTLTSKEFWNN